MDATNGLAIHTIMPERYSRQIGWSRAILRDGATRFHLVLVGQIDVYSYRKRYVSERATHYM